MSKKTPSKKTVRTARGSSIKRPANSRKAENAGRPGSNSTGGSDNAARAAKRGATGRKKKVRKVARQADDSASVRQRSNSANAKPRTDSKNEKKGGRVNSQLRSQLSSKPSKSKLSDTKPSGNETASSVAEIGTKPYFIEVDAEHAGQRIDNFLVTRLKGVPKTHIYRIIRKGEVRVNKGRIKQTTRLQEGDSVRIPPIRLADSSIEDLDGSRYEFLRKTILFEDDALLVINKPSGMAVHSGSGIKVGVIEAMRALRTDLKYLELVHRLDRETSGCLVLAKKSSALKILHEDFKTNSLKNKRLDKRYLALVKGHWRYGQRRITKPLNTDARKHGERYVVVDEAGSYASSIANPVMVSEFASLIEVKLLTGRTHQVRVHTQSEGHPIAGDARYGDPDFNKLIKKSKLSRLFLHASSLSFTHPLTGEAVSLNADLPDDLQSVIAALELS